MGTFCSTTSLETLMPGTTFDTATTSLASKCITQAENKIREIMSERYDTSADAWQTSTSTPPVVTTWCEWLSMGYLYENLSRGGKDAYQRADRYIKKAMDNMTSVIEYKSNVVDSSGDLLADDTSSFQVLSNTKDYHDTFAEDNPLFWTQDEDKLDDIADERE